MIYHTNAWDYEFHTILLDLNGTLTVNGVMDTSVPEKIHQFKELWYRIVLLTGDQRWNTSMFTSLGIEIVIAKDAQAKKDFALSCETEKTVAIWNARIDKGMFEVCKLRIATLQGEGIHAGIVWSVDIIMPSIIDAFNLLIDPDIFAATMKI